MFAPFFMNPLGGGFIIEGSGVHTVAGTRSNLTRTFGTTRSSARIFTMSLIIKRVQFGVREGFLYQQANGNSENAGLFEFDASDRLSLKIQQVDSSTIKLQRITTQVFRDPSAFMHIHIAVNTGLTTDACCKIHVNGTEITAFDTKTNIDSARDHGFLNSSKELVLMGSTDTLAGNATELQQFAYMSRVFIQDGVYGVPTDVGEVTDSGFWQINDASELTFGNNGFLIEGGANVAAGIDTSATQAIGGILFDGVSGTATFTAEDGVDSGDGPISILAWVNLSDIAGVNDGILQIGNVQMSTHSGRLQWQIRSTGQVYTNTAVSAGTWNMFVITHSGGALSTSNSKLYLNGSDVTDALAGGGTPALSSTATIAENLVNSTYFHGKMSQLAVWDDVLTAAEVTALYGGTATFVDPQSNVGNYVSSANLVHHFPMNELSGTTLDDTQNAANATLAGGYSHVSLGPNSLVPTGTITATNDSPTNGDAS